MHGLGGEGCLGRDYVGQGSHFVMESAGDFFKTKLLELF